MTPHALFASIVLYTKEFYDFAVTKLNPGGVLVTQSGPGSIFNITECNSVIYKTLKSVFTNVLNYACDIPSFGASWFPLFVSLMVRCVVVDNFYFPHFSIFYFCICHM